MANFFHTVNDFILLNENVYSPQINLSITDDLTFVDAIKLSPTFLTYTDELDFDLRTTLGSGHKNITINQSLNFISRSAPTIYIQLHDSFTFTQYINEPKRLSVFQQFLFRQNLIYDRKGTNHNIQQILSFNQNFDYAQIRIASTSGAYRTGRVGGTIVSSGGNNNPRVVRPFTLIKTITLISSTQTLFLRAPKFGNKDSYDKTRINTKTRGNELLVGGAKFWPQTQTVDFDFDTLSFAEISLLRMFLKSSLGLPITITDHENQSYTGIITNPSPEIKEERGDNCTFSTSLSIQL